MSGLRPLWRPRGTDAWVAAAAAAFVGALSATSTAGRSAKCCVTFRALLHSILTWMGLLSDQAGLGSFHGAFTSTIDRSSERGFAKRGSHIVIYSYIHSCARGGGGGIGAVAMAARTASWRERDQPKACG